MKLALAKAGLLPAPLAKALADAVGAWQRARDKAEAMRQRDRLLIAGGLVALFIGLDLMLALPAREKRVAIVQALEHSAHEIEKAKQDKEKARQDRDQALVQRQQKVAADLNNVGAKAAPRESLRFLLQNTLQGLPVAVTSLRAQPGEEVTVEGSEQAAAAAAPASGAATGEAHAAASRVLYRHRYDLKLEGELPQLLKAIEVLEDGIRPLRVERVLMRGDAKGGLQAQVTLITLGVDKTWLSL